MAGGRSALSLNPCGKPKGAPSKLRLGGDFVSVVRNADFFYLIRYEKTRPSKAWTGHPCESFRSLLALGFGKVRYREYDSVALGGTGADGVHVGVEQVGAVIGRLHPLFSDILGARSGSNVL